MTLVTYSDSRRFFQYKISPLFSTVFQKFNGRRLRNATMISNLPLYQTITDTSFVRSLMMQYFIRAIWWIKDFENLGRKCKFHNFHFLGKRSEIEHRLHRLFWTLKCFGIGYVLNWRYYSSLKELPGCLFTRTFLPKSSYTLLHMLECLKLHASPL